MRPSFWALSLPLALAALPAFADTLVDNVDGLTLDDKGRIERFSGLVIDNDGKVKTLLRRGDKRPAKIDYQVDGKGRVAMPGLVDSHVRVMELGLSTLTLDLTPARSLAEAQARVAAWAQAHGDKPWILGSGWNAQAWGLAKPPTAADYTEAGLPWFDYYAADLETLAGAPDLALVKSVAEVAAGKGEQVLGDDGGVSPATIIALGPGRSPPSASRLVSEGKA